MCELHHLLPVYAYALKLKSVSYVEIIKIHYVLLKMPIDLSVCFFIMLYYNADVKKCQMYKDR